MSSSSNRGHFASLSLRDSIKLFSQRSRRRRKIRLKEAQCKPPPLPLIENNSIKETQEWNIKSLPSDWEPNTKPSKVVRRLLAKREAQHEEIVKAMETKFTNINLDTEEKIRQAANIYKDGFETCKFEVENALKHIRVECRGEIVFTLERFEKATNNVFQIYTTTKNKLLHMNDELMNLESHRSDMFQEILKDTYARLHEVSHKLPFELQEYFETKIQNINEITMNNIQGYVSLKMHLHLHLKNQLRLWLQEIEYAKGNWMHAVKLHTVTDEKKFTSEDFGLEPINNWLDEMNSIVFEIDGCIRELVSFFQEPAFTIFDVFYSDMEVLAKKIVKAITWEPTESPQINLDLRVPGATRAVRKYNIEASNLLEIMKSSLKEVQKDLEETFLFLYRTSLLWIMHLDRLDNARNLVLKDAKRMEKENATLVCIEECKLNIAIDTLRQESEEENIPQGLKHIQSILSNIEQMYYVTSCDKECVLLRKILDLITLEAETLYLEIAQHLSAYEEYRPTESEEEETDDVFEHLKTDDETMRLMRKQNYTCKSELQGTRFWKRWLWKAISDYSIHYIEQNIDWAENFITRECEKKRVSLSAKLELYCKGQYERVEANIRDTRTAELQEHKDRLERHKAGVQKGMENINELSPKYDSKYNTVIEKYIEDITCFTGKARGAKKFAVVLSAEQALKKLTEKYRKNIEYISDEFFGDYHKRIDAITSASCNYAKAILMFSERGNFEWHESKSICLELSKLRKFYKKQLAVIPKANKTKFGKCVQAIANEESRLSELMSSRGLELQYNEKYKTGLKDTQAEVTREVFDLKFKKKKLVALISDLKEKGSENLGRPEFVDRFTDLYCGVADAFAEFRAYISRPEVNNYSNYVSEALMTFNPSSKYSTSTSRSKKGMPESKIYESGKSLKGTGVSQSRHSTSTGSRRTNSKAASLSDHTKFLFAKRPVKEENFISKVQHSIYTSFERMQFSAVEFYSKQVKTQFLVHPTYEDFIVDVLPKYIYYYLQCEMVWLDEAKEFIKMVDNFLQFILEFYKDFASKYVECSINELKQVHYNISAEITDYKTADKNEFFVVYSKLKPLHGYPGNKQILDELQMEINNFFQSRNEERIQPLMSRKADLEKSSETFKEELTELCRQLETLVHEFAEKSFSTDILLQFETTINYLNGLLEFKHQWSEADTKATSVQLRTLKVLEDLKRNLEIPSEYTASTGISSDVLSVDNKLKSEGPEDLARTVDINCYIQIYEDEKQDILTEIDRIQGSDTDIYGQWRNMWNLDIQKIMKLYDVKYNLPQNKP